MDMTGAIVAIVSSLIMVWAFLAILSVLLSRIILQKCKLLYNYVHNQSMYHKLIKYSNQAIWSIQSKYNEVKRFDNLTLYECITLYCYYIDNTVQKFDTIQQYINEKMSDDITIQCTNLSSSSTITHELILKLITSQQVVLTDISTQIKSLLQQYTSISDDNINIVVQYTKLHPILYKPAA